MTSGPSTRRFLLNRTPRTFRAAIAMGCLVALASAGCSNTPTTPSAVSFSQSDIRAGSGTEATAGKTLTVNYTGWLYDASKSDQKGLIFDTNTGEAAFTFTLGAGQVIPGWDQGLVGLRVGGVRRLVIPSSLAYGGVRRATIPPFSVLVFEVELLDVQ
jgi:FKBP-type peptidyl-prolyl cis-trans isomerase FkpA